EIVESWHAEMSIGRGGTIDTSRSHFLVLLWNRPGAYQLFQFDLRLPEASRLRWSFPNKLVRGQEQPGNRLVGRDDEGAVIEWYGQSGAQLKYYPPAADALWMSGRFTLEPLPSQQYGIVAKAEAYLPELWSAACRG